MRVSLLSRINRCGKQINDLYIDLHGQLDLQRQYGADDTPTLSEILRDSHIRSLREKLHLHIDTHKKLRSLRTNVQKLYFWILEIPIDYEIYEEYCHEDIIRADPR